MEKYAELIEKIEIFALLAEAKINQGKTLGPYRRGDGRWIIFIQDENGRYRTKSWPKFIMENHLGRALLPNETVDHWDTNPDNNNIDNLKVIDRTEHSRQDTRRVEMIKLKCPECGKEFERSPRLLRDKNKKGASGSFCSRQCAGKYNRKRQLGQVKKKDLLPPPPFAESKYYKQKYRDNEKKAFVDYVFEKYASNLDIE